MAVQAQYPSNAFIPELRNRARDSRSYASPAIGMLGEDFLQQQNTNTAGVANLFRLYNSGKGSGQFSNAAFYVLGHRGLLNVCNGLYL